MKPRRLWLLIVLGIVLVASSCGIKGPLSLPPDVVPPPEPPAGTTADPVREEDADDGLLDDETGLETDTP
ncbi:MAG: hypothetical protein ACFB6S_14940 [Geminicoccaceae bacterium]